MMNKWQTIIIIIIYIEKRLWQVFESDLANYLTTDPTNPTAFLLPLFSFSKSWVRLNSLVTIFDSILSLFKKNLIQQPSKAADMKGFTVVDVIRLTLNWWIKKEV